MKPKVSEPDALRNRFACRGMRCGNQSAFPQYAEALSFSGGLRGAPRRGGCSLNRLVADVAPAHLVVGVGLSKINTADPTVEHLPQKSFLHGRICYGSLLVPGRYNGGKAGHLPG